MTDIFDPRFDCESKNSLILLQEKPLRAIGGYQSITCLMLRPPISTSTLLNWLYLRPVPLFVDKLGSLASELLLRQYNFKHVRIPNIHVIRRRAVSLVTGYISCWRVVGVERDALQVRYEVPIRQYAEAHGCISDDSMPYGVSDGLRSCMPNSTSRHPV